MKLSVLIPTYNEADIIGHALSETSRALGANLAAETEVLIVDDGTDNLPEVVEATRSQYGFASVQILRNNPKLGKGLSLANGFQRASGEIVGFLDADLSTHPDYIHMAIDYIESGKADIFIGSRRAADAEVKREQFWLKDVLGDALSVGVKALIFRTGRKYLDTQCGFKFFKNEIAKTLYRDLVAGDGLTDIEILVRANIMNYRVHEQGVKWVDERESKRSLKRILVGEIVSISRILYHYGLFGSQQSRKLKSCAPSAHAPKSCARSAHAPKSCARSAHAPKSCARSAHAPNMRANH